MTDFYITWELVRGRFDDAVKGLNQEQLNYRVWPGAMTIGEQALHVAGAEISFCSQLQGETPEGFDGRLKQAGSAGIVDDDPFPFEADEITPELVAQGLARGREVVGPMLGNPDPWRAVPIKSILGPMIDGSGAFARLAYHPGYHQAQVYMIKTSPGFPVV